MSRQRLSRLVTPPPAKPRRAENRAQVHYTLTGRNVYDAALDRVRWLFDEFDNDVAVANSGGKDSTVCVELAAIVNAERGLPPLRVVWLDQEAEFEATVVYQRYLMEERDDIDFHWYQIPFRLENATNSADPWLKVWDPEHPEEWLRPKEPGTIHSSPYPPTMDHFYELLSTINRDTAPAVLTGMRIEESPHRRLTLTTNPVYKWVTWGTYAPGRHGDRFRFHPIYDWSYRDVWRAIETNGWRYNTHYDDMYRYGVPTRNMRVSNYHHETALSSLKYLQEIEPETWEKATRRLAGISTRGHLGTEQYFSQLPFMFGSWDEYALHLIDNLIPEEDRQIYLRHRQSLENQAPWAKPEERGKALVNAVITNDTWGTLINNFVTSAAQRYYMEERR